MSTVPRVTAQLALHTLERKVITLPEHGPVGVSVADLMDGSDLRVYPDILAKDILRVYLRGDTVTLQVSGFVGLLPLNSRLALNIVPRFPIGHLERMLAVSGMMPLVLPEHLRSYDSHVTRPRSLVTFLADAFVSALSDINARGLWRSYRYEEEDTSFPRGRILLSPTIQKHLARQARHKVRASRFVQTIDNEANRALRYALSRISAALRATSEPGRAGERGLLGRLNTVGGPFLRIPLDTSRSFMRDPIVRLPTRLPYAKSYYGPALQIAGLINRDLGVGLQHEGSEVELGTILLGLDGIFECYIRNSLVHALSNSAVSVLDGNLGPPAGARRPLLDDGEDHDAKPDIVLIQPPEQTGSSAVILETKYKKAERIDDLHQAIAYGIAYRAGVVALVLPRTDASQPRVQRIGRVGDLALYRYRFDLAATDIETEESALADFAFALTQDTRQL